MDDDTRHALSSALGWLSVVFWMFNNLPQLYETFLVQSGRGVSRFYLRLFTLGDLFNLIGCLLADQLHTQVYLGFWFLAFDLVLMCQLTYYDRGKADLQYHPIDTNDPARMIITPSLSNILGTTDYGAYNQNQQSRPSNNNSNHNGVNSNRTHVFEQNHYQHTGDGILSDQSSSMSDAYAHAYENSTATSIPHQAFGSPGDDTSLLSYSSSFGGTPYGYCSPSGSRVFDNNDCIASRSNSITSRTGMDQSLFTFFNERTREIEYDPVRRGSFHRAGSTLASQRHSHDESHVAETRGKFPNKNSRRQSGGVPMRSDTPDTDTLPSSQSKSNSTRLLSASVAAALCLTGLLAFSSVSAMDRKYTALSTGLPSRVLLGTTSGSSGAPHDEDLGILNLLGVGFGTLSAAVYLFARIPQVVRICRYGAIPITGVGAFVMWCGIIANICYGASVGVYCLNWTELAISIPWLLGSSGCVPLDLAIFLLPVCYHVPPPQHQRPRLTPSPNPNLDRAAIRAYREGLSNPSSNETSGTSLPNESRMP